MSHMECQGNRIIASDAVVRPDRYEARNAGAGSLPRRKSGGAGFAGTGPEPRRGEGGALQAVERRRQRDRRLVRGFRGGDRP